MSYLFDLTPQPLIPKRWTLAEDYHPTCVAASRRKNHGKAGFFLFDRINPCGPGICLPNRRKLED